MIRSKAMSERQGLSQLRCNGACIPCQAQSCLLHIPLARGNVCQDELDAAAPFGRLSEVQLPVQPMGQQSIAISSLMIWGVKPDMAHHMLWLKCICLELSAFVSDGHSMHHAHFASREHWQRLQQANATDFSHKHQASANVSILLW